jgi:SAM-dependent methyltransferase
MSLAPVIEPDWLALWKELVDDAERFALQEGEKKTSRRLHFGPAPIDRPDPLVEFVKSQLTKESTVIDIGAATGRWSIPLATVAKKVTAIDTSKESLDRLLENAASAGLRNIETIESSWEACHIKPHDVVINSHAMYGFRDLTRLVESMQRCAKKRVYLAMRVLSHGSVMADLNTRVHGHRHDSPNFEIGFHVLLEMGIFANVLFEPVVKCWEDESLEKAFERAKRHLRLGARESVHDDFIRETIARRLVQKKGRTSWPDWMRSALMWWEIER